MQIMLELQEARAGEAEARREVQAMAIALERARRDVRRLDGQLLELLALTPGRDAAVVFDQGSVMPGSGESLVRRGERGRVVVARFPKSEDPRLPEVVGRENDSVEAMLAASAAEYANYRRETRETLARANDQAREREREWEAERARVASERDDLAAALLECRARANRAESSAKDAAEAFASRRDAMERETAEQRTRFKAEADAARAAIRAEIEAAASKLVAERDAARAQAADVRNLLSRVTDRHKDAMARAKSRIASLKNDLRALHRRRNLETEGFHRDIAALRKNKK